MSHYNFLYMCVELSLVIYLYINIYRLSEFALNCIYLRIYTYSCYT